MVKINVYTEGELDMIKGVLKAVWHYDNISFTTLYTTDKDGTWMTEVTIKCKNPTRENDMLTLLSYALKIYNF